MSGSDHPSLEVWRRLLRVLGLDFDDLFTITG